MAHTERPLRYHRALIAVALLAMVCFAWLASEVARNATMQFDLSVRGDVHGLASAPLTWAMRAVTQFGSTIVLLVLGLFVLWRLVAAGRRRAALVLLIVIIGADVLDLSLKLIFHRARPPAFFGIEEPVTYSFPSGHAIMSCAFYGALAAILAARFGPARKATVWTMAALLVAAVGFSRVYLGVHYPTDVLGGYVVGVAWLSAVRVGYALRSAKARGTTQARMPVPR